MQSRQLNSLTEKSKHFFAIVEKLEINADRCAGLVAVGRAGSLGRNEVSSRHRYECISDQFGHYPLAIAVRTNMAYERFESNELTLRDRLAIDRTRLANERTVLSYLRAAFMLLVAGATVIKLFGDSHAAVATGWALIAIGVGVALFGGRRFAAMRRAIDRAMPPASS
ncbi:MAG: DUF202 domain-containing protein [Planctomycetes bacterium]|nr:DUF202 domain-containing protein [Planctomycetota bacterium]